MLWLRTLLFTILVPGTVLVLLPLALVASSLGPYFDFGPASYSGLVPLLAGLSLIAYTSMLGIMRVPYAMVLGTAGGVLEFVPIVGPLFAGVAMIAVAVLTGYSYWALLLLFLVIWRLVLDYVIAPRVMGGSVQLHPLGALFGVLAGGEIAGVLGVYLSIPVMASLRIVWRRWRIYAEKRRFGPLNENFLPHDLGRGRS